ncbi:MAG: aldehyde reductase [Pirellulaceae bacterium]|nr:MAG: aldehyde reductase [Pirellulaceae bacterium]
MENKQENSWLQVGSNGRLPTVGLGLWKIPEDDAADVVYQAIAMGYRHLDSACDYGNERQVGEGIRRALEEGICTRQQLWVTSKLWNTYHRGEHVRPAVERTLRDLGLEYLDLYLIHFPIALRYVPMEQRYPPGWVYNPDQPDARMEPDPVPLQETWQAMEALQRSGMVRHIGVSNFNCSLLQDLLSYAEIKPAVLQVESHPYLAQPRLLRFCQEQGIAFTAFSPLGAGSYVPLGMAAPGDSVLQEPVIGKIAQELGKTPAQVVLRWGVQRGTAVIPKSVHEARLRENLNLFDFKLIDEQMEAISALDRNRRFNDPGVFCEQAFGCFYPIFD